LYKMGLLSKAAVKTASELDAMGKALRDRILRLPRGGNTPYTALSLLKAYSSFQIGVCLACENGFYSSYASAGLGMEKIIIPREFVQSLIKGRSQGSYKIGSPETLSLKAVDAGVVIWLFPLDEDNPPNSILLLGEERAALFNPQLVELILSEIKDVLALRKEKPTGIRPGNGEKQAVPAKTREPPLAPDIPKKLWNEILQYHKTNTSFHGIVLELPPNTGKEGKKGFNALVSNMVSFFGTAVSLPSSRSLVLLPRPMDRELIAHRLTGSLRTVPLLIFEADSPDKALALIKPFL
jgi:hypothetical protein